MRTVKLVVAGAIVISSIAAGQAQQPAAPAQPPAAAPARPPQQPEPVPPADLPRPSTTDPRANLKPGAVGSKAAEAAWNMELTANLPKPEGFYDATQPLGTPPAAPPAAGAPRTPPNPNALGFTNSDLAFSGNHVVVGNYHGFNTYNIERANKPQLIASVVCPGGQGDVSIWGNLLFMSVEQTRGRLDCGLQGVTETVSKERFRGVRIFDITDLQKPKQVAAVQTCRGSHTHTLVPDPKDKGHIFLYASGTGGVRSGEELEGCSGKDAKEDQNTSLFSIDVIEVPIATPEKSRIVNQPRLFASDNNIAGLWAGGDHGPNTQRTSTTNQCHDITVYSEIGLAAGACSGNGILMDIKDPRNPKRLDFVADKGFAYWHSATFNNDGTKVVFTDEWGGGGRPRCRAVDPLTWGADAIYDIVDNKLVFKGYYKMPAAQTEQENCVAHNGSLIPVPGRDIMVQSWYQGGVSVFDFTDSEKAKEIAYFDRGPINGAGMVSGGYWSSYWYNGNIYGSEIARGIDVFRLKPSEHLSQNEIDAAMQFRLQEFNSQNQPKVAWPASSAVARAYLDQLNRNKGISAERSSAVLSGLSKVDQLRTGKEGNAKASLEALDAVAAQVEGDAKTATGRDAMRLKALAETLKGRAAALR
ncbi:MAG: hypothetical protein WC815_12950 [Vicinamibacterales bacterium]